MGRDGDQPEFRRTATPPLLSTALIEEAKRGRFAYHAAIN
jgi:hypothetical protein